MKQSVFIFITTFLICNSTFQSCSNSDLQELSTELQEDSSWQKTVGSEHFRRLPSFDCLLKGTILWRRKDKGDWMIDNYEQPYNERQIRFGSDSQVESRLISYVHDLTNSQNINPQNQFLHLPVIYQDQQRAIKLHDILHTEPTSIDQKTREQLQKKLIDFMCLNVEYLIHQCPQKQKDKPYNKKQRFESMIHIQGELKQLPEYAQNLLRSKYQ